MRDIFNGDEVEAEKSLDRARPNRKWDFDYEFDILMAFWLAIDRENTELVRHLYSIDINLRYIVTLALKGKNEKERTTQLTN